MPILILYFRPQKVYTYSKSEVKVEDDELDDPVTVSKTGVFYSPPKPKFLPAEGRGRINSSGSDSSISKLIIPEEDRDSHIPEQPEGKYSNKDARHSSRHKHRRHEKSRKGGKIYNRVSMNSLQGFTLGNCRKPSVSKVMNLWCPVY